MKPIHLTGMGVTGSLIALLLRRKRVEFTWSDLDGPFNAWRASTGGVFPSGRAKSDGMEGYHFWRSAYDRRDLPRDILDAAPYLYNTKAPPHGAPAGGATPLGMLTLYAYPSLHFNPQRLVQYVRALEEKSRRDTRPTGSFDIVTHGFQGPSYGVEASTFQWGWSVKVKVEIRQAKALDKTTPGRLAPSLYLRQGKFIMAYLYPVPGEPGAHYFGSHMIAQKQPKALEIPPKFEALRTRAFELSRGDLLKMKAIAEPVQGWRPIAGAGWDGRWIALDGSSRILCKPMGSSGFRYAPMLLGALAQRLKLGEIQL